MIRRIIEIDQEKCNGCGKCASACHEGAISMVDGKATLMREDYCDGLGDCLPACPTGAITFVEREAPAYDEAAVLASKAAKEKSSGCAGGGCPGSRVREMSACPSPAMPDHPAFTLASQLRQWPVQIKLAPVNAPFFQNADLLVAADCTAFSYGDFHNRFIRNRVCLVGCPKLDMVDYSQKLTQIIAQNSIKSLTIVRMEVPCCGGLEHAATTALKNSGKFIPWQVVTITIDGKIKGE